MVSVINWSRTLSALDDLQALLSCSQCNRTMDDACYLKNCDHVFCRNCVESIIGAESKCPQCGSFAWIKDLKTDRELASTINICTQLRSLLTNDQQETVSYEQSKEACLDTENTYVFSERRDCEFLDNNAMETETPDQCSQADTHPLGWSQLGTRKCQKQPTRTYGSNKAKNGNMEEKRTRETSRDNSWDFDENSPKSHKKVKRPVQRKSLTKEKHPAAKATLHKAKKGGNTLNDAMCAKTSPNVVIKSSPKVTKTNTKSVNRKNAKGETQLHAACIKGDIETCKDLLGRGAELNASDNARWTPLHEACNHGHLEIVNLLLDHGAMIGIQGFDNDTPLHDAVANNRFNVAKLLIERHAPLNAKNVHGLRPMDYAATQDMKDLLHEANRNENQNQSTNDMPAVISNPAAQRILVTTGLNQNEKKLVTNCGTLLNATISEEFCEEVTHVITSVNQSNRCPRTMKYLRAILMGKWIVNFKWIENCLKAKAWVVEDDYEVEGTDKSFSDIPASARKNYAGKLPALFSGCSFYLHGDFTPPSPSKEDVSYLIKLGGGTFLHSPPNPESHPLLKGSSPRLVSTRTRPQQQHDAPLPVAFHAPDSHSLCTQFIVFDANSPQPPASVATPLMATVTSMWLTECISQFKVLPAKSVVGSSPLSKELQ